MDVYEALYTTRAMRRVRPDAIPEAVQARILDAAIRAPTGGNAQGWRFLLVDDTGVKSRLGPIYRDALKQVFESFYAARLAEAQDAPDTPQGRSFLSMYRSAVHLGEHFEAYPLLLFAFDQMDPTGASIFPAVWSAMLAARAEGVGSALTTVLLFRMQEVLQLLEVPDDEGWRFSCCVTLGYPTGRWGVAPRQPVDRVCFRNRWGQPADLQVPRPLWPGSGAQAVE